MEALRKFWRDNWLTLVVVLFLGGAYVFLHTPGDAFASLEVLEAQLRAGNPTVVEFYSNSCSICLVSKPKVDALEATLTGQAAVVRLNVADEVGRALASRWGVRGVPTFFVVDGAGAIVYARAGAPEVTEIESAVTGLLQE